MKTKIQVRDLKKGDKLSSGARVLAEPTVGLTTPAGRCEVFVEYADRNKMQTWNKYTTVTVTNR